MDTREKIVDLDLAIQITNEHRKSGGKSRVITGFFDVLTADHVRGSQALADGGLLVAVVVDPPAPLLATRARAELAASLRVIDYVVSLGGGSLEKALEQLNPDEVIRVEEIDQRRTQRLIEHVHRRNKA